MLENHRIARLSVVLLFAVSATLLTVPAADKETRTEGLLLIRVERESRDDLSQLLTGGVPVVMEMRESLFVEGTWWSG